MTIPICHQPSTNKYYDKWLEESTVCIKHHIYKQQDDWLSLIIGATGTGKSNLALHLFQLYLQEKADIKYCGLNRSSIAEAMKYAKDNPLPRCCWLDEANISKRDSLTKFNKDMIDLFLSVRGLNVFWIWCNPSLDYMDKHFITERINGFYYIPQKMVGARPYYYFSRDNTLKIYKKYGNLTEKLLHKVRKKYAVYKGWFKEFPDCDLKRKYLEKKGVRMDEKVEEFFATYANTEKDFVKRTELKRFLGVTDKTLNTYEEILIEKNKIKINENMTIKPNGRKIYKNTLLDDFANLAKEKKEVMEANLKLGGLK